MANDKERIEKLQRALGDSNSRVNTLKITNSKLKGNNDKLIKVNEEIKENLTKSEEALTKSEEELNSKKTESEGISGAIDNAEEEMKKLKTSLDDLEKINAELVEQNEKLTKLAEENKNKSASVLTKSLAVLGVFATGAWLVSGAKILWEKLKKPPTSSD